MKISEWLGSILVSRVFETTLADPKWTDGGVKSDISTPIQGSSSVMNDYKKRQSGFYALHGGGESWAGQKGGGGMKMAGRDEGGRENEWVYECACASINTVPTS